MFAENVSKVTPISEVDGNGEQYIQFSYPADSGAYDDVLSQVRVNGATTITVVNTYSGINLESASATETTIRASKVDTRVLFGELPVAEKASESKTESAAKLREAQTNLKRSESDNDTLKSDNKRLTDEVTSLNETTALLQLEIDDLKAKLAKADADAQANENKSTPPNSAD